MLRIFFAFSISVLLISCNNDDDTAAPEVEVANFFALTVGNTYTYSYHQRDFQTGEFIENSFVDEVEITAEVVIEGETFFEFTTTTTSNGSDFFPDLEDGVKVTTVRDVSDVLQDQEETILFSNVVDGEPYLIFEDSFGDVFGERLDEMQQISVPAGDFNCNVNIIYAILNDGERSEGESTKLYVDGIGEVFSTISFVSNPEHIFEKRLTAFNIVE